MLLAHNRLFHRALFTLDLGVIGLGLYLSSIVGNASNHLPWEVIVQAGLVFAAWFAVSWHIDVYKSWRTERVSDEVFAVWKAVVVAVPVGYVVARAFWDDVFYTPPAGVLILLSLAVQRYCIRLALHRLRYRGRNYRQVALVGNGPAAPKLISTIRANQHYGIRLSGYVSLPESGHSLPGSVNGPSEHVGNGNYAADNGRGMDIDVTHLGDVGQLNEIIRKEHVDLVLVCPPDNARVGEINRVLAVCDQAGVQSRCSLDFGLENLYATANMFAGAPMISFTANRPAQMSIGAKRLMDTVISGIALVSLMPFWIIVAALIKLWDGGPVFFGQTRVGEGGQHFTCYKFRTMCVDAEARKTELLSKNEQDGPAFKVRNDPRVTLIGRFLRKYSLDELPQLFNVFTGDMSLVGPRPPTPDEVHQYEWSQRRRFSVRPGITCIWQVEGRNKVSFERWVEMDLHYIDNWSLLMDFQLLCRTVGVVARGTGS